MRLALLLVVLVAAVAQGQAMYKWVDEKGVTHFSETPPPEGKAQKVEVKPSAPASGSATPSDTWKQRDLDSRRSRIEGEQHEQARAKQARDSAVRKSHCDRGRRQLQVLETQVRVYSLNAKKEKVYVTDEERAREVADWKKLIAEHCES